MRAEKQAKERYEASPAETRVFFRIDKRDTINQKQMTWDIFNRTMMSWDNVNLAKRFGSRQSGSYLDRVTWRCVVEWRRR